MLKKITQNETYSEPCALLLGGFDGIHIGHKTLLDEALKTVLPVGITSICGAKAGGDLYTFSEREHVYNAAGCAFVWEIPFTPELKEMSPVAFLKSVFSRFRVKAVFCGEDFTFGKNAAGTPELLKKIAPCPVYALKLKTVNGMKVASTQIKRLLSEGNMREANALLIGGFFLQGVVEYGRRVGHSLGFPTVNLTYPQEKFPVREGVYGGYAETAAGRFPAIVNLGARPTFGVTERKTEAYLDGFNGDLYGQTVRIYPTEFYRPIKKFESREQLIEQLQKDIARLRAEVKHD